MKSLIDIPFSDLFVGKEPASSYYKATPDSRVRESIPGNLITEFMKLRDQVIMQFHKCRDEAGDSPLHEFRFVWFDPDAGQRMLLRVSAFNTAHCEPLFVCSRAASRPPSMIELGFPKQVVSRLMSPTIKQGLVIFCGRMRAGKTTAATAYVQEYTQVHGGNVMELSAPCETDLEGPCGAGYYYQQDFPNERALAAALPRQLRSSANIFLIGEMRYNETVQGVIDLASTGHPVVSNIHGDDLIATLSRADRKMGNQRDAFADAISAIIHLKLQHHDVVERQPAKGNLPGYDATPSRRLNVSPLFVGGDNESMIRSCIRDGKYEHLKSEVQRQKNVLLAGGTI